MALSYFFVRRARRPAARPRLAGVLLAAAGLLAGPAAQAQVDPYFSQSLANRLALNPAFAGLLDDYSVTLGYRNQLPQLQGAYQTGQLAADLRLPTGRDQHSAIGLLLSQDQAGALGYSRFEGAALYTYHTRLAQGLAMSGGLQAGFGRQRVGDSGFLFGDQVSADGTVRGPSAENANYFPVNYLTLGAGVLFYSEHAWLSLAGHNLNTPDLAFRTDNQLPLRFSASGGYKFFVQRPTTGQGKAERREISWTPTASYTRQGGSQRNEAGLYFVAQPVTLGALYRNASFGGGAPPQHLLAAVAGLSFGALRLGYSYDVGLSDLSRDLGGAHEITLALRAFDPVESAFRRLKRRNYPDAPCPAF